LYGDATEHRNMPTDDAIKFIYKDFTNKTKGISQSQYEHPDAVQSLLKTLAENRSLTVTQYDHIVKYLAQRREYQVKAEIGEESTAMDITPITTTMPSQAEKSGNDLQKKILEILNKKPLTQQITKPTKPLTQAERDELKRKLLQDDKIKQAMDSIIASKKRFSKN